MKKKPNYNKNKKASQNHSGNLYKDNLNSSKKSGSNPSNDLYVTELKILRQDEEKLLQSIIDNSLTGIMIIDNNYRFIYVNKTCCEFLKASKEEIIGHDFREFLPDKYKKIVVDRYIRRHRGEKVPRRYEVSAMKKNGEIIRIDIFTSLIKDSRGKTYSVTQIIDITERCLREILQKILHNLVISNTLFSDPTFLENLGFQKLLEVFLVDKIELVFYDENRGNFSFIRNIGNIEIDIPVKAKKNLIRKVSKENKIKLFNKAEIRCFAPTENSCSTITLPESCLVIPLISGNYTAGILGLYSKDRIIKFHDSGIRIFDEFATEFATYILHKKIEEETKRLATAIEYAAEYIVITDLEGSIQYVNPAFEKITGYRKEEAIGENPRILKSGKHDSEFYKTLWDTIKSGKTWRGEFINRKKDGTLYHEEAVISPVFDRRGNIINFVAVKHDITEKKNLETQYLHAQKMEAIGRLAGGIAHDFNNMLSVIMGYSELILNKLNKESEIYREIQEIYRAGLRSSELTTQLLAFARRQSVSPKIIDLNDEISAHLNMLRRLIGENIKLQWKPGNKTWKVKLDPGQLSQILNNLCINARDAISDIGNITIETRNVTLDSEYCKLHPFVKEGGYVMMAITDNGKGMDEDTKSHIFEPFFTTKTNGKGTGLGLSSVYGAVKQNNGFILVYSEPTKGTTFKIYFPKHIGQNEKLNTTDKIVRRGKGEVVLLVEDEKQILDLTTKMLEKIGYNVLPVNNPVEAVRIAGEYGVKISLLITDIVMPEMNGPALAKKIKLSNPDIKVLFMSGYTTSVIDNRELLNEEYQYIQKPFDITTLSEKIYKSLSD